MEAFVGARHAWPVFMFLRIFSQGGACPSPTYESKIKSSIRSVLSEKKAEHTLRLFYFLPEKRAGDVIIIFFILFVLSPAAGGHGYGGPEILYLSQYAPTYGGLPAS